MRLHMIWHGSFDEGVVVAQRLVDSPGVPRVGDHVEVGLRSSFLVSRLSWKVNMQDVEVYLDDQRTPAEGYAGTLSALDAAGWSLDY